MAPSPRRSLVTGANRGLGLEFVRQLLARGDRVVAACRHPGRATELNHLAGEHPGRLHVLPLDVADEKSRTAFAHELPLVADGIDLLVNNAGVLHSGERWGSVTAATLEDSLRTNAVGPFLLTQVLAPQLADGGTVANLSSMMSSLGDDPDFHSPSYRISKTALNMATRMLAKALAPRGISVIALCPGWVLTDMGGSGAQISANESVAALLGVIEAASPARSGGFYDRFGAAMAW
ncbi:SDR family oxidoreductase [Lysobacter solisilvae (ex Woo and Kim 2020)]|uniref:SDR family oxidoreductase n=1 Tax=Agrilutibacter terrestris TaxID=2865112 RepID=A0A7H0G0R9_9GAMM|nr:SDR family oxidoreductase [Lysobacter terrestris]QNP41885.1 SDR family oxidoreductase [Lysobacter terrestris]